MLGGCDRETIFCPRVYSGAAFKGVNSGVKQGESRYPIPLNIFINDLIIELNSFDIVIDVNDRNVCFF